MKFRTDGPELPASDANNCFLSLMYPQWSATLRWIWIRKRCMGRIQ